MNERFVAIMPARGGSTRIPRKNVRPFLGVPVIERTLGYLLASDLFDDIIVSTDDEEIARVAEAAGAAVPFRRSAELSGDSVPTAPVVIDALQRAATPDWPDSPTVCVVYPTSVFGTPEDLRRGLDQLVRLDVDAVISASTYGAPVLRSWRQKGDGLAEMVWPEFSEIRSQDLETMYRDAAQFYWWSPEGVLRIAEGKQLRVSLYLMERWRVHDMDDEEDWLVAEQAFQILRRSGRTP